MLNINYENENYKMNELTKGSNESPINDFKTKIITLKKLWDSDPQTYSSTPLGITNHSMSPKELFELVYIQPELDALTNYGFEETFYLISNSPNNRKESTSGDLFAIRTMYAFAIISGVADSNFFPLSLIDNSDNVEKKISHLVLKDRGNLVAVLKRANEEILNVNKWHWILNTIEKNPFNTFKLNNKRFKQILKTARDLLAQSTKPQQKIHTKHSLKTMVGRQTWDEWFNYRESINLRIKYETLGVHTDEMRAYNNSETAWVEYNFLNSTLSVDAHYDTESIDLGGMHEIHAECLDKDIFVGKNDYFLKGIKHKKQEGFESWFPIDYTALEAEDWDTMINELSRNKKQSTIKKNKAWSALFSAKDDTGNFQSAKKVKFNITLMHAISRLPEIEQFGCELESYIKNHNANKITNISDLSLQKHYNVAILIRGVKETCKVLYKDRMELGKLTYVARTILNNMIKSVKDLELEKFKSASLSTTSLTRYNEWYKKIIAKTLRDLQAAQVDGKLPYDSDDWWYRLIKKFSDNYIYPINNKHILLDRKESGQFVEIEIDVSKKDGLHDCHMNPKGGRTSDNMFLGLPLDNEYLNNKPITNLADYISKFQLDLDEWSKSSQYGDVKGCIHRTRIFTDAIIQIWNELGNK